MASTYGWPARRIEAELTDELLVLYLDAAADRILAREQDRFDTLVEGVRAGTVFASNLKAHAAWQRRRKAAGSRGLTGPALERAVGAFAFAHPEYVVMGSR